QNRHDKKGIEVDSGELYKDKRDFEVVSKDVKGFEVDSGDFRELLELSNNYSTT
ncbi:981_t:CDS:1, partial [Funneliformis caledonium]